MSRLAVVGYDVVELLGAGGCAEVWLARETGSGDLVALKWLRSDRRSDADAEDLRREAAALSAVSHPRVLRLRAVTRAVGGAQVLVLDHAAGGALSALLGARGRLSAGEVVALAAPLADALAAMHAQGQLHGDVTPGNMLLTADGEPLLGDLGAAGERCGHGGRAVTAGFTDPAVAAGASPGSATDVHGLAATCFAALTGRAPYDEDGRRVGWSSGARVAAGPLVAVLERALSPDSSARPSSTELGDALRSSLPATSLRLSRDAGDDEVLASAWPGRLLMPGHPAALTHRVRRLPARPVAVEARRPGVGRRRAPRPTPVRVLVLRCAVAVALLAGLVGAGATGRVWAGGESRAVESGQAAGAHEAAATAAPAALELHGWRAVVEALDRRRGAAYSAGSLSALARVYAPESPAWPRDRSRLRQLIESGLRVHGLRYDVASITVVTATRDRVVLRVVDRLDSYTLARAALSQVTRRQGRGPVTWRMSLRRAAGTWRVYDVERLS